MTKKATKSVRNTDTPPEPVSELHGISIQEYADGSFTITTPSKHIGVSLVLEVRRRDGSAWRLLASIFNEIDEQYLYEAADHLRQLAEDAGQNPPDVEIELRMKNAEFLKNQAA